MTVTPGTGLLSQDSERSKGRLMRSRELTPGLATLPASWAHRWRRR
jgi:hypothetical protein